MSGVHDRPLEHGQALASTIGGLEHSRHYSTDNAPAPIIEMLSQSPEQAVLHDPQHTYVYQKMAVNGSSELHVDSIEDAIDAFSKPITTRTNLHETDHP